MDEITDHSLQNHYFRINSILMIKLQMVDLYGQYKTIKEEIDQAIKDTIESCAFINGPQVKEFKIKFAEYLNCKHVITCGNGTDALQIAMMGLRLSKGDEVLVPNFTFVATAEAVALLGLQPVFVEVDQDNFLIDTNDLERKISPKTKAIIPVHLFGQCANMDEIMNIASEHNLKVIEDNAQAIGSDVLYHSNYFKSGSVGHVGCTSFFPSKNLGCFGDGGAICTNDDELGELFSSIANHGSKVKYYNDLVGVNSRLDTIQAAVLLVKLKYLDEFNQRRQQAAETYDKLLTEIPQVQIPKRVANSTHVFHQYTLKVEKRDELKNYLGEKGVPSMVYYPMGMHQQKPYKTEMQFDITDHLCKNVLSLPMHSELNTSDQEYIADTIKSFYI